MCICPTLFFGPLPVTFWLPHPPSPFLHPRGSTRLPEFQLPELWPRNSLQVGSWLATRTVIESLSLKSLSYAAWCPMSEKSLFHIFCPFLVALFSSVQSLSRVRLFATPWTATRQPSLSIMNSWSLLKLMSMESVTPSNHLILCHPLLLLPLIFPSIRVF